MALCHSIQVCSCSRGLGLRERNSCSSAVAGGWKRNPGAAGVTIRFSTRFHDGTVKTAVPVISGRCMVSAAGYGNTRIGLRSSSRQANLSRLTAKFRSSNRGAGRAVVNAAVTGVLVYLAFTGKLGWVFDAIISLWLIFILAPLLALVAYFWFLERKIIKGNCPNCGNGFQVFEFAVKDLQLCPYCSQPFKVENKVFVRNEPRYGSRKTTYAAFNRQNSNENDSVGVVVDVEAEILDD